MGGASWRRGLLRPAFNCGVAALEFADRKLKARLRATHQTNLGEKLMIIEAQWAIAADDHSHETPAYGSNLFPGFPCHIDTEFIERKLASIDRRQTSPR